jgi:hypothetical protein
MTDPSGARTDGGAGSATAAFPFDERLCLHSLGVVNSVAGKSHPADQIRDVRSRTLTGGELFGEAMTQ